jgi:hypothetical protein
MPTRKKANSSELMTDLLTILALFTMGREFGLTQKQLHILDVDPSRPAVRGASAQYA